MFTGAHRYPQVYTRVRRYTQVYACVHTSAHRCTPLCTCAHTSTGADASTHGCFLLFRILRDHRQSFCSNKYGHVNTYSCKTELGTCSAVQSDTFMCNSYAYIHMHTYIRTYISVCTMYVDVQFVCIEHIHMHCTYTYYIYRVYLLNSVCTYRAYKYSLHYAHTLCNHSMYRQYSVYVYTLSGAYAAYLVGD